MLASHLIPDTDRFNDNVTALIFCSFNRKCHVLERTITGYDSTAIGRRQLVENVRLEEVFEERAEEKKRFDAHGDT